MGDIFTLQSGDSDREMLSVDKNGYLGVADMENSNGSRTSKDAIAILVDGNIA
jgi:hypothetical protein